MRHASARLHLGYALCWQLQRGKELPLVDALIEAGSDVNFNKDGKTETPLIGAASLGADDVGLRLLEAGAKSEVRGKFGETALYWAALLGEDGLG
jgi:ankyrin repeat protein